jgi:putative transposase
LWAEHRQVRKDAAVKLFGGIYETDPALAGRTVELVFDPFDMSRAEVRWRGKPYGLAIPRQIRRDAHPKARPEQPDTPPPAATGVDYLSIIAAKHAAAQQRRINYGALATPATSQPGQAAAPAEES